MNPTSLQIDRELHTTSVASFCCGICRQAGVPCERCFDYDPRIVEETAPPKRSWFAFWFKTAFWSLVGIMLLEDLRMIWWAWIR